jgi:hypothetical protein
MTEADSNPQLRGEVERGRQATDLLEHPLMAEAFEAIRQRYLSEWENSPARDSQGREKIWTYLKQLEAVKAHLTEVVTTGKMAQMEQEERSLAKRLKDGIDSFLD